MNKSFLIYSLIFIAFASSCQVKLGENIVTNISSSSIPSPIQAIEKEVLGQVEFKRVLSGEKSNISSYEIRVINNEEDFQKLWEDHTGAKTNNAFLPKIDFNLKKVVGIFLGDRPTAGYQAEIDKIEEEKDKITVFLKEKRPQQGNIVKAEVTQPFLIVETKSSNKTLVFENSSIIKPKLQKLDYQIIEVGYDSGIKMLSKKIATDEKEFSELYKEHLSNQTNIVTPIFPKINFNTDMVAAIFLGQRSSNNYTINLENVLKSDSQVIIEAEEVLLDNNINNTVVTYPYVFVKFPKTQLPINFDLNVIVQPSDFITNIQESFKTKELNFKNFLSGDNSGVKTSQYLLLKSNNALKAMWNVHSGSRDSIPPDIDFTTYDLIATFMGKKDTTGYSIKINSVVEAENELRVFIDLNKDNTRVSNTITYPFNMVLVPKVSKNPTFIVNNLIK